MAIRNEFCIILGRICPFPYQLSDKVATPEYFITYFSQVVLLVIIYGDKNNAILRKKIASDFESRIYHIQPIGVKTTIGFGVALHGVIVHLIAIGIKRSIALLELIFALSEIIIIDEVITCIIGRVNVNHLDTTEVGFAENFEDIEVIALNIKIFGRIEINRFFTARAQSEIDRLVCQTGRSSFVGPGELIAFFAIVERVIRQFRAELVEVDGQLRLAILI